MNRWTWLRLAVLALIVATEPVVGFVHGVVTPARWWRALAGRSEPVAVLVFIAVFVTVTVALLSAGTLSQAAGVVFGPVVGVVAVWVGTVAGSAAAFGIGRALSRPAAQAHAYARKTPGPPAKVRTARCANRLITRYLPRSPASCPSCCAHTGLLPQKGGQRRGDAGRLPLAGQNVARRQLVERVGIGILGGQHRRDRKRTLHRRPL